MQQLSSQQVADYLETATIDTTHDTGFALVHTGTSSAGARFVLSNDCHGGSTLTESL